MVLVNQFSKPPYYFPGRISSKIGRKVVKENCKVMSTFHVTLRRCETPPSRPAPDSIGIKNCKQLFFITACIYDPKNSNTQYGHHLRYGRRLTMKNSEKTCIGKICKRLSVKISENYSELCDTHKVIKKIVNYDGSPKHPLRTCEIPRSVSKTVNNFFHYGLHLRPKKKQHIAEMMSVLCVVIL